MAGGGGGGFIPPSSESLQKKIEREREREKERLDADVEKFVHDLLAKFNDRDVDSTRDRLDELHEILGDQSEVEQLLLGGSVAKHTYVDGLSDVDALVVLDRSDLQSKTPKAVLSEFHRQLKDSLPRSEVKSITKGNMAVTVTYRDGTEIQLLPALRSGNKVSIADATGKAWKETKPKTFQKQLTRENQKLNNALVPAIKLMKSAISSLPKQQQLTGYHVETLALDAAKHHTGKKTPKDILLSTLEHASKRVLKPCKDATGQNRTVDAYLGAKDSVHRRNAAQALAGVKRRLESATTVAQWRAILED